MKHYGRIPQRALGPPMSPREWDTLHINPPTHQTLIALFVTPISTSLTKPCRRCWRKSFSVEPKFAPYPTGHGGYVALNKQHYLILLLGGDNTDKAVCLFKLPLRRHCKFIDWNAPAAFWSSNIWPGMWFADVAPRHCWKEEPGSCFLNLRNSALMAFAGAVPKLEEKQTSLFPLACPLLRLPSPLAAFPASAFPGVFPCPVCPTQAEVLLSSDLQTHFLQVNYCIQPIRLGTLVILVGQP